ncbi:predicted protein [Aspergillus terreus NIH2624]|uniref:Uncharacterized protein n=1 Tax=Aspergillus terreus (strain NIH 2624 / FGSC A1156) TaxID=341663 RepID=Q0CYD8_ASPTN|nr:uncharacterized protein ATEG_01296 [Aspergillus terreus NIH2624]EAU38053.1 predicted protein [Aspergillus terreus NIH2624]
MKFYLPIALMLAALAIAGPANNAEAGKGDVDGHRCHKGLHHCLDMSDNGLANTTLYSIATTMTSSRTRKEKDAFIDATAVFAMMGSMAMITMATMAMTARTVMMVMMATTAMTARAMATTMTTSKHFA